jgi:hypothetical protein
MPGDAVSLGGHLADMLHEMGFRAVKLPNNMIESATRESKFFIFVQEDGWLQFGLRFSNQVNFGLEDVNTFNCSYRFGKLCLDPDGDLFFSADMRVSSMPIAETFKDCTNLWDQLVGVLLRSLQSTTPATTLGS